MLTTPHLPVRPTALLVDDNVDRRGRDQAAAHLTRHGYEVVVVTSRQSAVAACERISPVLIVVGQMKYTADTSELLHGLKHVLGLAAPAVMFLVQRSDALGQRQFGIAPPIPLEQLLDFTDVARAA